MNAPIERTTPLHAHRHEARRPLRGSLMAASAAQRLLLAAGCIALLWAAIWWALR